MEDGEHHHLKRPLTVASLSGTIRFISSVLSSEPSGAVLVRILTK
jgi:hypothetical protein